MHLRKGGRGGGVTGTAPNCYSIPIIFVVPTKIFVVPTKMKIYHWGI